MGMKTFFKSLLSILESIEKAREATELSRQGKYEEAKRLFSEDRV